MADRAGLDPVGQALIGLDRGEEAAVLLEEWVERWQGSGFLFHAAAGGDENIR